MDFGIRDPEWLGVVDDDGKVVWRTLATELSGAEASTDHGWHVDLFAKKDILVGFIGSSRGWSSAGGVETLDLTSVTTAGFRRSNGQSLGQEPGTSYQCLNTIDLPAADGAEPVPG